VALHVLRSLEDQLLRGVTHHLVVRTRTPVALYILNQKRAHLSELEQRFGLDITVVADESIANGSHFQIERGEPVEVREAQPTSVQPDSVALEDAEEMADHAAGAAAAESEDRDSVQERSEADESGGRRRRRRRRRKGGEASAATGSNGDEAAVGEEPDDSEPSDDADREQRADADGGDDGRQRKRRRGRRGGRRGRRSRGEENAGTSDDSQSEDLRPAALATYGGNDVFADPYEIDTTPAIEPDPRREPEKAAVNDDEPANADEMASAGEAESPVPSTFTEADRIGPLSFRPDDVAEPTAPEPVDNAYGDRAPAPVSDDEDESDEDRPKRSGWWQRRSFF